MERRICLETHTLLALVLTSPAKFRRMACLEAHPQLLQWTATRLGVIENSKWWAVRCTECRTVQHLCSQFLTVPSGPLFLLVLNSSWGSNDYIWKPQTCCMALPASPLLFLFTLIRVICLRNSSMENTLVPKHLHQFSLVQQGSNGSVWPLYVPCLWFPTKLKFSLGSIISLLPLNNSSLLYWEGFFSWY